jgi:hypothetical protein
VFLTRAHPIFGFLDPRLAVSCGEDRAMKLWDLSRGFCVRSVPCAKMPNVLACSIEGSVIATGVFAYRLNLKRVSYTSHIAQERKSFENSSHNAKRYLFSWMQCFKRGQAIWMEVCAFGICVNAKQAAMPPSPSAKSIPRCAADIFFCLYLVCLKYLSH